MNNNPPAALSPAALPGAAEPQETRADMLDRVVRRQPVDMTIAGKTLYGEWLEPTGSLRATNSAAADAPPLVFLHEGLGSVPQWTARGIDFPADIAHRTERRVFVCDRLGFGRSDALPAQRKPDYHYDEAVNTLPAVMDFVGIDAAVLVGHSDGATIALITAARCPSRVVGAVVEAPHVVVEDRALDGIRVVRKAFHDAGGRLRAALERYHGAKTASTFSGWADVWLAPEFADFSMLDDLPSIVAPLLIIQGSDDEYATGLQPDLIAAGVRGPVTTRIVPDCLHVPHFDAYDIVAPLMADFIASLPQSVP